MMDCLFCNISKGTIPAHILYEDEDIVSFRDVNPQAPTHLLIIPKKHLSTIDETQDHDALLLGRMVLVAKKLALSEGLSPDGYRLIFNVNTHGGQTVYHIHLHLLGGRPMTWPPG